eukprot:294781-Hanusia_phi.AAC.1
MAVEMDVVEKMMIAMISLLSCNSKTGKRRKKSSLQQPSPMMDPKYFSAFLAGGKQIPETKEC